MAKAKLLKLNVGGTPFTTTEDTLLSEPESLLTEILADEHSYDCDGRLFLDLDGESFQYVLSWLRHHQLVPIPTDMVPRVTLIAQSLRLQKLLCALKSEHLRVSQKALDDRCHLCRSVLFIVPAPVWGSLMPGWVLPSLASFEWILGGFVHEMVRSMAAQCTIPGCRANHHKPNTLECTRRPVLCFLCDLSC